MAPFWKSLLAITPPSLSELVLELGGASEFTRLSLDLQGYWAEIDQLFEGLLDRCPDFKLVIRTGRLDNRYEFQARVKARFSSMARVDRVRFETSSTVDKYWGECSDPCHPKSPGDLLNI